LSKFLQWILQLHIKKNILSYHKIFVATAT
jgi:hypothetical protein